MLYIGPIKLAYAATAHSCIAEKKGNFLSPLLCAAQSSIKHGSLELVWISPNMGIWWNLKFVRCSLALIVGGSPEYHPHRQDMGVDARSDAAD